MAVSKVANVFLVLNLITQIEAVREKSILVSFEDKASELCGVLPVFSSYSAAVAYCEDVKVGVDKIIELSGVSG